jgi:hypothetical protein
VKYCSGQSANPAAAIDAQALLFTLSWYRWSPGI